MSKFLIQLLVPVESGLSPSSDGVLARLKKVLVKKFGGFTAYTQAPAEGMWAPEAGRECRDNIIVVEVMAETLNRKWWGALRRQLEADLKQEALIVRAQSIEML